jgi:diguanylate cyclase (GGDEF)-like protein
VSSAEPPDEDGAALPEVEAAHLIYTAVPFPLCLLDTRGCLAAMNPAAERFWSTRAADVLGRPVSQVLGIRPVGTEATEDPLATALSSQHPRVPCRITTRDGLTHRAALVAATLQHRGYAALAVLALDTADSDLLTDPVTGLPNRAAWQREHGQWLQASGTAVLLDLDDLKGINDRYGHLRGDEVLALVGATLRSTLPPGALAVRWGGDEFLVLLPRSDEPTTDRILAAMQARFSAEAAQRFGFSPHISAGCAPFGPGQVDEALQQADAALYENKGVLLRASGSGARLVLTREGQTRVRRPSDPPEQPTAAFSTRFTGEFDSYFRKAFARAVEQAQRFVEFVDPKPGIAAIEVGAGAGRITFDGRLAQRIGPGGQLLVTDPSEAQLQVAQRRAAEAGYDWIRFLPAPAEVLPVASACADLVIGSTFLHFTDPARAIAEMARVLRSGGILALSSPLPFSWSPFWAEVLTPVYHEATRLGLPASHGSVPEEEIYSAATAAGLQVVRSMRDPDLISAPTSEVAQAGWAQGQFVALMLKGAPSAAIQQAEEDVLNRILSFWDRYPAEEREIPFEHLNVVARKA